MRKNLSKIKNPTKAKEARRKLSIRKKVIGSADRPRLCVTKSNKHLRVQIVDDAKSVTLFSVQTFGKEKAADQANAEGAKKVGAAVWAYLKRKILLKPFSIVMVSNIQELLKSWLTRSEKTVFKCN